jgi:hypothetical protein
VFYLKVSEEMRVGNEFGLRERERGKRHWAKN